MDDGQSAGEDKREEMGGTNRGMEEVGTDGGMEETQQTHPQVEEPLGEDINATTANVKLPETEAQAEGCESQPTNLGKTQASNKDQAQAEDNKVINKQQRTT